MREKAATNLTLPTIKSELLHLEKQDLLQKESGGYILSEVSRRLLLVKRCADRINAEALPILVNCMDKSVIAQERHSIPADDFAIECRPKYTADDISLEDEAIRQCFIERLGAEADIPDDDGNYIVESLYIDAWKMEEPLTFITRHIEKLPCCSGIEPVFNGKETVRAKGTLVALSCTFGGRAYSAYFDTVSGRHIFGAPTTAEKPKAYSLELPKLHSLSPEEEHRLMAELKAHHSLGETELERKEVDETEYYVDFPLSDLFGEEA